MQAKIIENTTIYVLEPHIEEYIWGGTKLRDNYYKNSNSDFIGETWELSCHPAGETMIKGTDLSLSDLFINYRKKFGVNLEKYEEFPLLVKLIDAKEDLAIQVHPDDEYALKYEGQNGKTEMWYIVDCEKDSYVYCGFIKECSETELLLAIENGTIVNKLKKIKVQKGDSFYIPAGTIHAIGSGCLVAEVQQNSNLTYRIFDYNRNNLKGKLNELHIEKAGEVINLKPSREYNFAPHLVNTKYFIVDLIKVIENKQIYVDEKSFRHLLALDGPVKLSTNKQSVELNKGEGAFVSASTGELILEGETEVLCSYIDKQEDSLN